jgi:hypothetical protein
MFMVQGWRGRGRALTHKVIINLIINHLTSITLATALPDLCLMSIMPVSEHLLSNTAELHLYIPDYIPGATVDSTPSTSLLLSVYVCTIMSESDHLL